MLGDYEDQLFMQQGKEPNKILKKERRKLGKHATQSLQATTQNNEIPEFVSVDFGCVLLSDTKKDFSPKKRLLK